MFKTKKASGRLGLLHNNPQSIYDNLTKFYEKVRELVYQSAPHVYAFHRMAHYMATENRTGFRCEIIVHMQTRGCKDSILAYLNKQHESNKNRSHPDRLSS